MKPDLQHLRHRRVLVTGATGLVGSHLTTQLVDLGAEVIALVRDYVPNAMLLRGERPDITIVGGALEDAELLARVVAEYEIEVVFHLGAQTIVTVANASPLGTFRANIAGTWNLLEACRQSKRVRAVVVASSDKAYGRCDTLPYTEETPLRGEHPYDVSKSCADLIARAYAVTYALPVAITRCGNIFGPGDLNYSRLVPGTIRSVLRRERPEIRSDGRMIRDYFYVKDAARAYAVTATMLLAEVDRVRGEAFNFSTGEPMDVITVVNRILTLMKATDLEPRILNEARAEIAEQSLCSRKSEAVLGWTPAYTFDQGLAETIAFLQSVNT